MQDTLHKDEPDGAQPKELAVYHQCPACQQLHVVHPVLHRVACGRQLTCSAHCRQQWKQQVRQAIYQRRQGKFDDKPS